MQISKIFYFQANFVVTDKNVHFYEQNISQNSLTFVRVPKLNKANCDLVYGAEMSSKGCKLLMVLLDFKKKHFLIVSELHKIELYTVCSVGIVEPRCITLNFKLKEILDS